MKVVFSMLVVCLDYMDVFVAVRFCLVGWLVVRYFTNTFVLLW